MPYLVLNSVILVCLVAAWRRLSAPSIEHREGCSPRVGLGCGFASCLGYYVPLLIWNDLTPIPITHDNQWNIAIGAVLLGLPVSVATLVCGLVNQRTVHSRLIAQAGFFLFLMWLLMSASGDWS